MRVRDPKRKTQDAKCGASAPRRLCFRSKERGLSLIAVMWIITILTVLASEYIYSVNLEVRIASNWNDQVKAFYAAKGGFETAIVVLKEDKIPEDEAEAAEPEYDSLDEDWAQELTAELNDGTYETMIIDESAKININTADEETLTNAIVYCIGTADLEGEMAEEEMAAEAQVLAAAIIEARPFRTVAEMAKVQDMTPEILYGEAALGIDTAESVTVAEGEEQQQIVPLVDITTVYSADKNVAGDGSARVNINSADSGQIQQGINPQGQQIITQQEAQAIVDYRDEQGNNQQGQAGGQGQAGMPGQGAVPGQEGDTEQQSGYTGIGQLLDVPAISQQTFDSISNRLTLEDRDDNRININTADSNGLQSLNGIDSGIADSIVNYRNQNQFESIEGIREVKVVSIQDMRTIVDRVTISDDDAVQGKVNINTAPLEILTMLPGMDEDKAQAIVDRRTVEAESSTVMVVQQGDQQTGPFTSIGELLDVQGIDENTFRSLIDHVSCRSAAYMIKSEGKSSDGKITQLCTGVVDLSGDKVEIKYWKQD